MECQQRGSELRGFRASGLLLQGKRQAGVTSPQRAAPGSLDSAAPRRFLIWTTFPSGLRERWAGGPFVSPEAESLLSGPAGAGLHPTLGREVGRSGDCRSLRGGDGICPQFSSAGREWADEWPVGHPNARAPGPSSSKDTAISQEKSQEDERMAVGLLKAVYQPSVILLLEQGKEPWMVKRELAKGLCSGWESMCETEELTPKQDIYEAQSSQKIIEKLTSCGLEYSSLREEWKCEGHFERQLLNQKACLKEETITHEEALSESFSHTSWALQRSVPTNNFIKTLRKEERRGKRQLYSTDLESPKNQVIVIPEFKSSSLIIKEDRKEDRRKRSAESGKGRAGRRKQSHETMLFAKLQMSKHDIKPQETRPHTLPPSVSTLAFRTSSPRQKVHFKVQDLAPGVQTRFRVRPPCRNRAKLFHRRSPLPTRGPQIARTNGNEAAFGTRRALGNVVQRQEGCGRLARTLGDRGY
ncbi:hypothetical protein HPG69_012621 [Diceros bicornis minor]|uniref:Uncharacterized protein n=1 Tax=Diceros bicornis minor TaxID=77932 RepID=A0A7J7F8S6_DICBM|nr:hypothetical protein HPG69_012621 [Diceros bicornis minor]